MDDDDPILGGICFALFILCAAAYFMARYL